MFCDANIITPQETQILESNVIRGKLLLLLNHPKYDPIGIMIEFQIFEFSSTDEFKMIF